MFRFFHRLGFTTVAFCEQKNSAFLLFQTLEFTVVAFPNIGVLRFGFSKHWNSGI